MTLDYPKSFVFSILLISTEAGQNPLGTDLRSRLPTSECNDDFWELSFANDRAEGLWKTKRKKTAAFM
jgi:hypothetical protein